MGFDQIKLTEGNTFDLCVNKSAATLSVTETEKEITIAGDGFIYVYDRFSGIFKSIRLGGKDIITRPMQWNIWRAPTDNDRNVKRSWIDAGYNRPVARAYETEIIREGTDVILATPVNLTAVALRSIARINAKWRIRNDGAISLSADVKLNDNEPYFELPFLPRFGIRAFLPREFDSAAYYGYGPYESYSDKHIASYIGLFEAKVGDMHEDYIKPQENGSHFGCKYMRLADESGCIEAYGDGFSFNVSEYTQEELTEKKHNFELEKSGMTILCLDYKQAGIGSNSCGPELPERERIEKEFHWDIDIMIKNNG